MQILILGMHRSGTSLVTRMVNMMGAYVGPEGMLDWINKENPKGFWERKDLVDYNRQLLKLNGITWANVAHWSGLSGGKPTPPTLQQLMKTLILNMDAHRPWVMKDPRLCITLPYWKPLLEVPVGVIVYRDPLEITESLRNREREPMSIERGIALWEFYATTLLNASADIPKVFVSHSDFLYDPVSTTAQLYHGLAAQGVQGLRLPSAREINAFIDKKLYRSKPAQGKLTLYQHQLIGIMRGDHAAPKELTLSENSKNILQHPVSIEYA